MKCPVCLNENCVDIIDNHVETPYKMVHCLSCDVVFSDPMEGATPDWYETDEYCLAFKASANTEPNIGWYHTNFFEENLQIEKILDIGCGKGDFIKAAKNKGYSVTGIDFDKTNIEIAKENFSLKNVYAATLEEFIEKDPSAQFDAITFFEVLEHLPNPGAFLENVKKLLAPNGYIVLSVPNRKRFINTISHIDKPPYHMTRWTETALKNLLEHMGFASVRIYTAPIKGDDFVELIRFGVGQKLITSGREKKSCELINLANKLYAFKHKAIKCFTGFIAHLLRTANCQGSGIYCLAQISQDNENE